MASQEQFDFYMTLAKPLALSLANTECRARACAWLKYLGDCEDSQLKVDYVKLLIFVLQKNNPLRGPFSEVPPDDGSLQPFPDNASLTTMMLRVNEKVSGEVGAGDSKPQVSEFVSADLKQFVALQTLPGDRGIQCYMAVGSDEMNKWEQSTSSSCSCNNLSNSGPSAQPLEHLQPATYSGFPARYSPMIRYQRQRRRMDQLPSLPPRDPNYKPPTHESTWLPTKEEVYWLKRMNKMIRRPGGPDTNFMEPVRRYYAQANRSQTTDEDWDPFQAQEEGPTEYPPEVIAAPVVDQGPDDFADEFPEGPSMESMYPQTTMTSSHQHSHPQHQVHWPVYEQDMNVSYGPEAVSYSSGRPAMQQAPAYDMPQSCDGSSTCSPSKSRPRWAKKQLDFSDQSLKFYPLQMEAPRSPYQYDTDYSQSQASSSYNYGYGGTPQGQRSFPPMGGGRGPQSPVMYRGPPPRRPQSPASDLDQDPSRIVVFHCQCACKK